MKQRILFSLIISAFCGVSISLKPAEALRNAIVIFAFAFPLFTLASLEGDKLRIATLSMLLACVFYRVMSIYAPGYIYIFPILALVLSLMPFLDKLAVFCVLVVCVLFIHLTGFQYWFYFFLGPSALLLVSRNIRRLDVFRSGILGGLINVAVAWILLGFDEKVMFALRSGLAFASGIISGFISLGSITIVERIFGMLTNFTLLELQDPENPILRELREKALGTFHHSATVADIAYEAAEAVGANALLVRCAALYHDIGKVARPEYFSENVLGNASKHLRLNPKMSAKIITMHVKDGAKIAAEKRLPKPIVEMIAQHHGTTALEYFVAKSKLMNSGAEDMRYPGPKPQTPETAILMIADSVEAASRSLEKITSEKIDLLVDRIVEAKMRDGQFDECPITLRDIKRAKDAIKKALKTLYHSRISYDEEAIKEEVERIKEEIKSK